MVIFSYEQHCMQFQLFNIHTNRNSFYFMFWDSLLHETNRWKLNWSLRNLFIFSNKSGFNANRFTTREFHSSFPPPHLPSSSLPDWDCAPMLREAFASSAIPSHCLLLFLPLYTTHIVLPDPLPFSPIAPPDPSSVVGEALRWTQRVLRRLCCLVASSRWLLYVPKLFNQHRINMKQTVCDAMMTPTHFSRWGEALCWTRSKGCQGGVRALTFLQSIILYACHCRCSCQNLYFGKFSRDIFVLILWKYMDNSSFRFFELLLQLRFSIKANFI